MRNFTIMLNTFKCVSTIFGKNMLLNEVEVLQYLLKNNGKKSVFKTVSWTTAATIFICSYNFT